MLLDTRVVVVTLLLANAITIPLIVTIGAAHPTLLICTLIAASKIALLIHALMLRALVGSERHRLAAAESARQLELRLAELERAQSALVARWRADGALT